MIGKLVEFVNNENNRLGYEAFVLARNLGWVREKSEKRCHCIGIAGLARTVSTPAVNRPNITLNTYTMNNVIIHFHLLPKLPPGILDRELVIRVDEAV